MAWQFDASTDQIIGDGWGGTDFSILITWFIDTDPNDFQNPILVYSNSGGTGSVRAGIGTSADGTTMTTFDAAFLTQAGGSPGVGSWYHTVLTADDTSWTTYHGASPGSLTTVGPSTRTTVTAPGSIVLSLAAEWWRGRLANLKIYNRTLSLSEVQAELGSYAPVSSTNLIRAHSMLTSSMAPDYGSGGSLTAGSTPITVVAGPSALDLSATVAGSTSPASGQLTAAEIATAALAGSTSPAAGALTGGQVAAVTAAAVTAVPSGALTASETRTGELAAQVTAASGALTAIETRTGELAASSPPVVGALLESPPIEPPVRVGTPVLGQGTAVGTPVLASGYRVGTVTVG